MEKKFHPYDESNIFSKITFYWIYRTINKYKNDILDEEFEDKMIKNCTIENRADIYQKNINSSKYFFSLFFNSLRFKIFYIIVVIIFAGIEVLNAFLMYKLTTDLSKREKNNQDADFRKVIMIFSILLLDQIISNLLYIFAEFLISTEMMLLRNHMTIALVNKFLKINQDTPSIKFNKNFQNLIV